MSQDFTGYIFKCRGQYLTQKDEKGKKRNLGFSANVAVPSANVSIFEESSNRYSGTDENGNQQFKSTSFMNYRGVLKKKLLPLKLAKQYPDFLAIKTLEVEEVVGVGGADVNDLDLPITLLSLSQIKAYCQFHAISKADIDPQSYLSLADLRTDVYDYMDSRDAFRARKEKSQLRRANELAFRLANDIDADAILAREPQIREPKGKVAPKPQKAKDEPVPAVVEDIL